MLTKVDLTPTSTTFFVPAKDGKSIPSRCWGDENESDMVALLVHGLGAHSSWFEAFGRQCASRRIFAISFDLTGFGKNTNEKIMSYNQWLNDLVTVFQHVKNRFPQLPVFLIGNSMGGLLSLVATDRIQPDGLVLLSPGLDGSPETFTNVYRVRTIISALIWPDREVALPYDERLFCRDETARAYVHADSDGKMRLPGRLLLELLKLSNATKSRAHSVKTPVLMMTAGQDHIVNNALNKTFFEKLNAPEKTAKHFEDAYHDLMFDPLVDEVADEVVQWMSSHAQSKEA